MVLRAEAQFHPIDEVVSLRVHFVVVAITVFDVCDEHIQTERILRVSQIALQCLVNHSQANAVVDLFVVVAEHLADVFHSIAEGVSILHIVLLAAVPVSVG